MLARDLSVTLRNALQAAPVVALLGPRQVGKTTLARHVTQTLDGPAIYLDLERPSDANKLAEPELYLTRQFGKTVVLDEVQRQPDLFPLLRSLVDEQIRAGSRSGQYLVLGSASPDLLRQSSESLAGRIIYLELTPMHLKELEVQGALNLERHWIRGGFPLSYLAETEENSLLWRTNFIRTYLERDLPQLGLRLPAEQLQRFWAMLGHGQGNPLNASRLASSLGVTGTTIRKYLDLLTDLYMVRQLRPWSGNSTKRLVKSPKTYVRDSGLLHSLTNIHDIETLLAHPMCGSSWEGYVIESLCLCVPNTWDASYYRTSAQAEVDLVFETPQNRRIAIEIKRTLSPKPSKGFRFGAEDIGATDQFFVIPHGERRPLDARIDAIGLIDFVELLGEGTF